jgi:hypothetical protein
VAKRSRLYTDYRRATPSQNVRMGYSPTARRYIRASVTKVSAHTQSISARQYETMRVYTLHGVASPEIATKARAQGAIGYKSAQARATARDNIAKAYEKRTIKHIVDDVASGKRIRQRTTGGAYATGKRAANGYRLPPDAASRYFELRELRLNGDWIDEGDWHFLMDMGYQYDDPMINALRAYPPSYNVREAS